MERPSNPHVVLGSARTTLLSRIQHASRFNQEQLNFLFCVGFVLDTLWNHEHLSGRHMDRSITKIDSQIAVYHDERLIGIFVVVPDEVALQSSRP